MNYDKEKDYIKEMQGGVLLNDYTLTDVLWFMKNYRAGVSEAAFCRMDLTFDDCLKHKNTMFGCLNCTDFVTKIS